MDDTDDDARYPPHPYGVNQGYGSSQRQKLPVRNASYPRHVDNQYAEDDDDEEEEELQEEDEDDDDNEDNGVQRLGKDEADDEEDDEDEHDSDRRVGDTDQQRHRKKRKLKSLLSSYEFAPRVPAPTAAAASVPKPSYGGRNSLTDWTEQETFILLDAWGDKFLQNGRKSLRSEEWQEVAEKVSQDSKIERTDTQCRNRLDTLKKKYKKEKMKLAEMGDSTGKWVHFRKMDMLMSSSHQEGGLSCGVDSGEYVFMSPTVYLHRANGLDEMRDSPGNSESEEAEDDDSDGLPPNRKRDGRGKSDGSSFRLLADSIQKFSEIYEKIENSKREQMLELEKMRMEFHRDLELQKRQILERAQAEIAKMQQGDYEEDEDDDVSADNIS